MPRWEALVNFDDEIRGAAEVLFPFGSVWVDKLGEAFFALNEDRTYLPNIVARLQAQAMRQEADDRQRQIDEEVERRRKIFARTQAGEAISAEAFSVLLAAEKAGYLLAVERDRTVKVTKGSSTSYLRSNADIIRWAGVFSRQA